MAARRAARRNRRGRGHGRHWGWRAWQYPAGDLPEPAATAVPDPADEVALRHWLTTALATLTARERAVVVLRYLFDLPEAAVARDLGVTPGTVKSTSSRALAKLRVSAESGTQPVGVSPAVATTSAPVITGERS